eukprot:2535761-Amphidinium_carterae.1
MAGSSKPSQRRCIQVARTLPSLLACTQAHTQAAALLVSYRPDSSEPRLSVETEGSASVHQRGHHSCRGRSRLRLVSVLVVVAISLFGYGDITRVDSGAAVAVAAIQSDGGIVPRRLREVTRLQQEVQTLQQQQTQMQAAQIRVSAGHIGGIDTRIIGKPDTFTGRQEAWKDWAIVLRSYSAASMPVLAMLMEKAETTEEDVRNLVLSAGQAAASTQLYYLLIMSCRDSALRHHNPSSAARHASLLLDLLAFSFEGDVQARLEEYDRVMAQYESITKQLLQDDIRLGVVIRQLPEGPLRTPRSRRRSLQSSGRSLPLCPRPCRWT